MGGGAHLQLSIDKFLGGGSSTDFKYLTLEKGYFWVIGGGASAPEHPPPPWIRQWEEGGWGAKIPVIIFFYPISICTEAPFGSFRLMGERL